MEQNDFILIISPCPLGATIGEGYMSRIGAVDRIFQGTNRIYLNPMADGTLGPLTAIRHTDEVTEYRLDLLDAAHHRLLEDLILRCRFVYVHTIHFARFVLPFYPTGKIVTDVHGIVPEEERMLGRPSHGTFYEGVERVVLADSRFIVVVTDAMRHHLVSKHPDTKAQFIVLPIIELLPADLSARRRHIAGTPYRAIYAGGTQPWQNIDLMLDLADRTADFCDFEFLSLEHQVIRAAAGTRAVSRTAKFGTADKSGLPARYLEADFGFVLRDDTAVNRVSCPTKLSEYLWFGVIPIVKSPSIGDFPAAGYRYITAEEFADGVVPDEAAASVIREHNRAVVGRLLHRFVEGRETLRELRLANAIPGNTLAGLPVAQRNLVFPNQAELYLFGSDTHYFAHAVIEAYRAMSWTPEVNEPIRSLRLIPLIADVTVALAALEIEVEETDLGTIKLHCVTPGTPHSSGVYLRKAKPFFDIHFSVPAKVRAIAAEWMFAAIGLAASAGGTPASGQTVTATLRSVATGAMATSAVEVTFAA